ncbi:efflux RND transporter permease subunit [Gorillibacterium sp. sgz5001074]|uniref:efflux RND transporter permease subunit n=1 Tax=Gorillibacterium sp. sgz5001074 TaxID=3446695 RepID=UPI003F661C15
MNIARISIQRPVTLLMLMAAVLLAGTLAILGLPVDFYPKLDIPTANISVAWTGASPAQVESQITEKVEAAVAAVPDVTSVTSISRTGTSVVTVQFGYGTDMDQAALAIRDKMDRVRRQLPSDAEAPIVTKADPSSLPVMTLALHGEVGVAELRQLAETAVAPAIQRADGVASVQVNGGVARQILVEANPEQLAAYSIPITTLVTALGNENLSLDAGTVDKGSLSVPLHFSGEYQSVEEIGETRIPVGKGQFVPLKELATVQDTFQETTQAVRFNGEPGVSLAVMKQSDGNTVEVSKQVQQAVTELAGDLPPGVRISTVSDQSVFIGQSISTVIEHTVLGGAFAVVILLLFLGHFRATLIISLVIPVSVMGTFGLMSVSEQTLNTITLGGLALGLGSLVDFAVVVLESIFRKRSQGYSAKEAAELGTKEVGLAVTASALAQIIVFLPTLFIAGLVKQIFMPLALVVIFSHIAALAGAVTLVPMLAVYLLRKDLDHGSSKGFSLNPLVWFGRLMNGVTLVYAWILKGALKQRWVVYLLTGVILAASVPLLRHVDREMLPKTDDGQIQISVQAPAGTAFEVTDALVKKVEDRVEQVPELERLSVTVGSSGGNNQNVSATAGGASVQIQLLPLAERSRSTEAVAEEVRKKLSDIPGANIRVSVSSSLKLGGGGGGGADLQVNLYGPDMTVLKTLGEQVAAAVSEVPGTRDVVNTLGNGLPEYELRIDREAAAFYGVTTKEVAAALRTAYQGAVSTQYKAGDDQISVLVRYPKTYTEEVENLNRLTLISASGTQVPLSRVASVEVGEGPVQIKREDQERTASVQASVFGSASGTVAKDVKAKLQEVALPEGYRAELGGEQSQMASSFKSLGYMLILSVVLVYMVMAGQFESMSSPFVILFSLPPTMTGALLGLYLTDRTLNMSSLIGMVMLVGLVVNNAIVLIDCTIERRKEGMDIKEALVEAGKVRLRPILMTAGATVLAMLPLVIGGGEGSESQASMATVVSFGLTLSTLVTLILVPVTYSLLHSIGSLFRFRSRTGSVPGGHGSAAGL